MSGIPASGPWSQTGSSRFVRVTGFETPFEAHYDDRIKPLAEDFEIRRRAASEKTRKRIMISVPAGIAVALLAVATASASPEFGVAIAVLAGAGLIYWCVSPSRSYRSSIKTEIYPRIFEYFGNDFSFEEQSPISVASLEPSGILPAYQHEHTDDYVRGSWSGVDLELVEARLTKQVRTRRGTRTVTVFKGMFILFEMNKRFEGKTVVKRDQSRMFNWLGGLFSNLEPVRLEDPEFERRFEVRSSNQIEARYLLTPSFMERLIELAESLGSPGIQCSFYDDRMLLMLPSGQNRFETGSMWAAGSFVDDINNVLREMDVIFRMIDDLNLEVRTGL